MQRELAYRSGYVLQLPGYALVISYLYLKDFLPEPNQMLISAYLFLALGVLISGVFLKVRSLIVRPFILAASLTGLVILIAGIAQGSEWTMTLGLAFSLAGAAGLAAKEANCFNLMEGWLLLPAYLSLAGVSVWSQWGGQPILTDKLIWIACFVLCLSLTLRKLAKPVPRTA